MNKVAKEVIAQEVINRMCPLKVGDRVRVVDELGAKRVYAKVLYGDTGTIISFLTPPWVFTTGDTINIMIRMDMKYHERLTTWYLNEDMIERVND